LDLPDIRGFDGAMVAHPPGHAPPCRAGGVPGAGQGWVSGLSWPVWPYVGVRIRRVTVFFFIAQISGTPPDILKVTVRRIPKQKRIKCIFLVLTLENWEFLPIWSMIWSIKHTYVLIFESYRLWPKGPGFESPSPRIAQARVRLATNTLPHTPHRAGALCIGYTFFFFLQFIR